MRKGEASLDAFPWVLAGDPSEQPWCCNGFHQSLQEETKTEELRYLAHKVEMPIRELRAETGRQKYGKKKKRNREKRHKGNQEQMEKQAGETPVMSQTYLATTPLTQ